jgi:hypothetical protein
MTASPQLEKFPRFRDVSWEGLASLHWCATAADGGGVITAVAPEVLFSGAGVRVVETPAAISSSVWSRHGMHVLHVTGQCDWTIGSEQSAAAAPQLCAEKSR